MEINKDCGYCGDLINNSRNAYRSYSHRVSSDGDKAWKPWIDPVEEAVKQELLHAKKTLFCSSSCLVDSETNMDHTKKEASKLLRAANRGTFKRIPFKVNPAAKVKKKPAKNQSRKTYLANYYLAKKAKLNERKLGS